MDHSLHLDELLADVTQRQPRMVLLQIPEGLKSNVIDIESAFASKNIPTITVLDPSFGACDIADHKAKLLGCDLLVHFGHSKMLHAGMDVIYWPVEYPLEEGMIQGCVNALGKDPFWSTRRRIGIYVTIQFHRHLPAIRKGLEDAGYIVFVGQGDLKDGQVLGCDVSARREIEDKIDANIYFGDGYFHALAIAFSSKKPTYLYNPFTRTLEDLQSHKEKYLRQRFGLLAQARDAQTFAIILCTKRGQLRKALALKMQQMLAEAGKKGVLVSMEHVSPDSLLGIKVDAYVNTSCSRIATDDFQSYAKPMLTPIEVEILLGKRKPEDYVFDEIRHLGTKVA
ncbi:MAG: diphthamide biosynthesis enzyme Dph2 [Candidatus Diapherotrites archaeon]|nr:diphthamide biosynthesis enzyme Dph2 [Candidatus Diapherotrites archaeon]